MVACDEAAEGGAARLWWLLRHFGHEEAAVLDGGLEAWREEGGPLRAGEEDIEPGNFVAHPRAGDTVTAGQLAREPGAHILLDARAPQRYRGEVEPIDPVAGRIPGARNVPFAEVAPGGRFRSPEQLRELFRQAGARSGDDVVAYCGSGITACVLALGAEVAGLDPIRLYPGSWSEWSARGLAVERG